MQTIEIPFLGTDAIQEFCSSTEAVAAHVNRHILEEKHSRDANSEGWHSVVPCGESTPVDVAGAQPADLIGESPTTHSVVDSKRNGSSNDTENQFNESHDRNRFLFHPNSISPLPGTRESIDRLVASILGRFPLGDPAVISFVCSEHNPHLELTTFATCRSLASMHVGNVLLIDSTLDRKLTTLFQLADNPGLSNLLVDSSDWEQVIEPLPDSGLEFLPSGTSHWEHWGGESELRKLVSQLKKRYQFILVASGEAHRSMAKIWSGLTDGDYLLVSVSNSHPAVAESAISELQASGARLIGCVVTDHEQGHR